MNLPIRLRLTIWYSALLAGALILFSIAVYLTMANTLLGNLDTTLRQRVRQVNVELVAHHGHIASSHEERTDQPLIPAVLLSPTGHVMSGTLPTQLRAWLRQHQPSSRSGLTFSTVAGARVAISPRVQEGRTTGYILVWESTRSVEDARRSLLLVLLAAGPALLLVAGLGGFTLARRALEPVTEMTHTAAAISASDLSRRVPVGTSRDELSELAVTFNEMIDRLEAAVERERRFTSDASHELRSPLAVIRAEATLALERPRTAEEYRVALSAIDEQAAAMEELLAALLMLARAETSMAADKEEIALADLVGSAVAEVRAAKQRPEVTIECHVPEDVVVEGSPPLLTRAIRNLVDNAVKVSKPGDTIDIDGAREDGHIVLEVQDEGPGITTDQQDKIFEPFYQVVPARTPGESHGLGLAISRRIMEAHGGTVTVQSAPGQGARFRMVLPAPQENGTDHTVSQSQP